MLQVSSQNKLNHQKLVPIVRKGHENSSNDNSQTKKTENPQATPQSHLLKKTIQASPYNPHSFLIGTSSQNLQNQTRNRFFSNSSKNLSKDLEQSNTQSRTINNAKALSVSPERGNRVEGLNKAQGQIKQVDYNTLNSVNNKIAKKYGDNYMQNSTQGGSKSFQSIRGMTDNPYSKTSNKDSTKNFQTVSHERSDSKIPIQNVKIVQTSNKPITLVQTSHRMANENFTRQTEGDDEDSLSPQPNANLKKAISEVHLPKLHSRQTQNRRYHLNTQSIEKKRSQNRDTSTEATKNTLNPINMSSNQNQNEESGTHNNNNNSTNETSNNIVHSRSSIHRPVIRSLERMEAKRNGNNQNPHNDASIENQNTTSILFNPVHSQNAKSLSTLPMTGAAKIVSRQKSRDRIFSKGSSSNLPVSGDSNLASNTSPKKNFNGSKQHLTLTKMQSLGDLKNDGSENKIVQNFSFKTKPGSLPGKPIKQNQDAYIIHPNFTGQKDRYFFGVCDGHGINGHIVSGRVKQNLVRNIEQQYKIQQEENPNSIKDALQGGFLVTAKELQDSNIDVNFSGTTCVSCLVMGNKLWVANTGDSRAVMGKMNSHGVWSAFPLSRDQKPDDPIEKERILAAGGRIEQFKDYNGDPVGPFRVWLKHENVPGLAMARSFGDGCAAKAGVIPDPEIKCYDLTEEDKFIIIASDGVWEFMSNEQVINMISHHYNKNQLESACDKVIREATIRWRSEDDVVDDITCVIVSLKVKSSSK